MLNILNGVYWSPDGAGAGAGGGGDATGGNGQDAAVQETAQAQGGQEPKAETAQQDPKARAKAYHDMVRGEYRDLYDADVQKIVQQRLRGAKAAEESMGKIESALGVLKKAYGVEDLDALSKAITDDDRFYEDEAMARGMDVQTYKELRQKDEAIARYRAEQEAARERAEQTQQVMQWRAEEAELKKTFPDFDLETEIDASQGELFQMLKRGISLEHAYLALHMDDIVGSSLQGAMQRGAQLTMDAIRANGMRPAENGAGNVPGRRQPVDMSKMTKDRMRDIERRLMRGEEITVDKLGL